MKLLQTKIEVPHFIRLFSARIEEKVKRFFALPFSIWPAIVLAFVFGTLSPIHLRLLDYKCFATIWDYNSTVVPWSFLLLVTCVLALLYWGTKPFSFRAKPNHVMGTIVTLALFSESLAISYFGCFNRDHMCMGGHLDHPSYSKWVYMSDAGWALGLISAVVAFGRCCSPLALVSATVVGFMVSMRFIFGSFGGIYYPFF